MNYKNATLSVAIIAYVNFILTQIKYCWAEQFFYFSPK